VKIEVRLESLESTPAAYVHAGGDNPEEDASAAISAWGIPRGLYDRGSSSRLFGRNTYPTDKPEPHGYEFFLTLDRPAGEDPGIGIEIREIPGGLYAVLRITGLENIGKAWTQLFEWVEASEHQHVGWRREDKGWVGGFEEHLNFSEALPPSEWVFDLWVRLKE